ncbi:hypothetical protein JKF63_04121 [Porcisia hertigi]|uniref:Uncharacterized protein n=1 Tax=Porcisia hertigi TaxID=2761500 RepID=A0A836ING9_9TRYP|nr:hypothetical protein JKF63_04121 [Porcisia hertigi]
MVRLDSICACARSHLVRAMANVGYRLALQWTAVVSPSATVIGVTKLVRERLYSEPRCNALRQSGFPTEDCHQGRQEVLPVCELLVILRLLGAITTLRPVLSRAAPPTIDTLSSEVDVVFVDESTWSKLACLVNLVRCCPTDRAGGGDRRADAAPAAAAAQGSNAGRTDGVSPIIDAIREHQKFLQLHEERLLLCGMTHALACAATSTQKAASCDTEGAIVATDTAVLGSHTTGLRSSAHTTAPALPDVSAEFVCALMKFWRTWTDDWPLELHAAWLQKLASIVASVEAAVCTGMEGAYGKGGAGGSTSPTGSTAEQAGVQVGVSSSPWFELPSDQCDHQCLLVQRQLCSALNEAWATMTDAWHDSDPLDMCACWYAFSATSRKPRCPSLTEMSSSSRAGAQPSSRCASSRLSQQLSLMATACEDRFCCMCETWLRRLRDLPSTAIMSSILQSRERRPMLRNSAFGRRQGHASLGIGWCPVCLPAIVSQVALRVLYRGTPKYAPNAAGATPIGSSAAAEPLCISDAFLDVVRRAILAPATEELAAFQLSVVSRYVGWCEAAGVHVGWCACAVQAHRTAAAADVSNSWGMSFQDLVGKPPSAPSMPWWVLTVDGLAVGGGVQSSVNIATILFLWEHGVDAAVATRVTVPAAGSKASCFIGPRHHHHLSGHTSSIRPLMSPQLDTAGSGTTEESCSTSPGVIGLGTLRAPSKAATEWGEESDDCDGSADEHLRMRRCIVEWGHRYALRLVLLEVLGDGWQRSRDAVLADLSQRQLPGQALCAAWRGTSGALTVARKVTVEGHAKTSDGESVVPGATSAYRTALSGLDITPRFVWHSDAYQPLVCLVADNAARMVDQLAAEVLAVASSTVVPPLSRDSHAKAAGPRAAVQFTGASSMRSLVMDKHPEQWRARIVAHLWSALRDSPVHATTSGPSPLSLSDHGTITPFSDSRVPPAAARYSLWRHQQPRGVVSSDAVVRLERLLAHLGLAPLSKREVARHAPCGIMSFEDVAEESLALLNSLLLCPELVCTSPRVTSYLNTVLWQRCWACLMRASRAVFDDRMGGRPASLEGFDDMAAQLDVLVTFRTILFTLDRMQQLVQELVEYLCCVFVPAVQTDRCAAWMVETPVEAISRLAWTHSLSDSDTVSSQTTRPQHTVTSKEDTVNARDRRRMFCFSAAAVRTFEVLCLGRRGGEQRAQRVWQQWTRDLICEDRILRQHPLLRST